MCIKYIVLRFTPVITTNKNKMRYQGYKELVSTGKVFYMIAFEGGLYELWSDNSGWFYSD